MIEELLGSIFGRDQDLSAEQMACRAIVIFFVTLALIRISGRRSFGQHTPFDACITVLLGAVLSRAVVGASPMIATVCACIALVLVHRLVAMLAVCSRRIDRWVNGEYRVLATNGQLHRDAMRKGLVSEREIHQALRENIHAVEVSDAAQVFLERNGTLSVVVRHRID